MVKEELLLDDAVDEAVKAFIEAQEGSKLKFKSVSYTAQLVPLINTHPEFDSEVFEVEVTVRPRQYHKGIGLISFTTEK